MIIDTIKSNYKIILFGFVFLFGSSVGQSFFIGLFNSDIRKELNISHGEFGSIYAIATLCSSFLLIWIGKKIDDFKLVHYSIFVIILLAFSSLFFSFVNDFILLTIKSTCSSIVIFVVSTSIASIALDSGEIFL